jgi:putative membrane protein
MSVFKKICTGLMISTLSFAAYAAQPGSPEVENPDQIPTETQVDVSDTRAVIQVLYVSNASEIKLADLVRERNPDEDLRRYADELARDHAGMNQALEALANVKSISLKEGEMEEPAQLVDTKMDQELQNLAAKPQEQFRSAFLEAAIVEHQKTLEFYSQIEQGNSDDALKVIIAASRQLIEKHLADAQRLKAEMQEPQQPGSETEQPVE